MSNNGFDDSDLAKWDPGFVEQAGKFLMPFASSGSVPKCGAWSACPGRRRTAGGQPLRRCGDAGRDGAGPGRLRKLGYDRPLYTLAHYGLFKTPLADTLRRLGVIGASQDNTAMALHSGGLVLVFPGGDYDAYRPTFAQNKIDFNGRKGYVRAAIEAGVPVCPRCR